ncbi:MAG: hypothetical protein HY393_02035 [Candidatus Diapherotrites archaeon]|nr:hypothetical protein [Candidatus Diapherotrites archaeon]
MPRALRKTLARKIREEFNQKKYRENPALASTGFSHITTTHLLDKLGYTGKKREQMQNAIAHQQRIAIAQVITSMGQPISVRSYKSILKNIDTEAKALSTLSGLSDYEKSAVRLAIEASPIKLREISSAPDEQGIEVRPLIIEHARMIHAWYIKLLMGEKNFEWYSKNHDRFMRAIAKKLHST